MLARMTTQTHDVVPQWTISDRLRKARENAGFDQGELARRMDVSRRTVSTYETGNAPKRLVLRAWALATGVSLTWIETGQAPSGPTDELPRLDLNQKPAGYRSADVVYLGLAA